jgi:DNA-binding NarL/FixJ family response regulator
MKSSERLHISPKTVGTHVQRVLVKLDLHSRVEAVAYAYRERLVDGVAAHALAGSRV